MWQKISLNRLIGQKLCRSNDGHKVKAGLVDIDSFVLAIRLTSRVEGNFVIIQVKLTKDASLFELKIRLKTFKELLKRVANLARAIQMDLNKF